MVGSIPLAKATTRYEADPRLLQHLHAVKHIWLLTTGLTRRNRNIILSSEAYRPGGMGLFQVVGEKVIDQTDANKTKNEQ